MASWNLLLIRLWCLLWNITTHTYIRIKTRKVCVCVCVCVQLCSGGMPGNVQRTPASLVSTVWHVISWNLTQALQSQTHLTSARRAREGGQACRKESPEDRGGERRGKTGQRERELSVKPHRQQCPPQFCLLVFVCSCLRSAFWTQVTAHHPARF